MENNEIRNKIISYNKGEYIYPNCARFENLKKSDVIAELKKMLGEGYVVGRYFLNCDRCENEISTEEKHILLRFVRTDKEQNVIPKEYYLGKEISINVSEPDAELVSGLNDSAKIIHQNNKEKGFWEKDVNIGEMLMLVVSELGEAMEAHRKGNFFESFERFIWFNDWAKNNQSSDKFNFHNYIKDSFEDEIADAIIRLLDLSAGLNIDIEKHINFKVKYNKTREKLHGKKY